ncbi:uncharacterized protein FIBRA_06640 [Fibroporia radiculosa]|uniref:Riboflavin synthase n=1 Tax=Fibroporia radiculosa TaxID=599839 RepID=J4GT48_9APHY|nr:uncharacterized protein FIBRA_06640 [Fibroporia radiculosa]CCM04460.1 predicted protein [Fibroporia radiculosa]
MKVGMLIIYAGLYTVSFAAIPKGHAAHSHASGNDHRRDLTGLFGGWDDNSQGGETQQDGGPGQLSADARPTGTNIAKTDSNSINLLSPFTSEFSLKTKSVSTMATSTSAVFSSQATSVSSLLVSTSTASITSSLGPVHSSGALSATSSGSSSTWKIVGVAVISFTAVALVLVAAVFFDHWRKFMRDILCRRRSDDGLEELVPDWEKASWEVRFKDDRHRYPSFASIPVPVTSENGQLQRKASAQIQDWTKYKRLSSQILQNSSALVPVEKMMPSAGYPAPIVNAYLSPHSRPNSSNTVNPFIDGPGAPTLASSPTMSPIWNRTSSTLNNLDYVHWSGVLYIFILERSLNVNNFDPQIEHLGVVSAIEHDGGGCTLTITDSAAILSDCHAGDSIAVNGACLTVTEFDKQERGGWFRVWLANETLERTDLGEASSPVILPFLHDFGAVGERQIGDQVNLERAMGAHVRFGGHFVQAHVDTTAMIINRVSDGDSLRILFQIPEATADRPSLLPYLIPKGYVAIDGTSLTITSVDDENRTFEIMLIKHTQEKITLSGKPIGSKVNIEVDMVGKYVEKSVHAALGYLKPKVTARVDYDRTRPASPFKPQVSAASPPTIMKPKAKVNSSATAATRRAPRSMSPAGATRSSGMPTSRAPSPFKQVYSSPSHSPSTPSFLKARVTTRNSNSQTSSTVTETRQRALTTVPSDSALSARARQRRGSVSSNLSHATSPTHSEPHVRGPSSPAEENGSAMSGVGRGVIRVKSKVSKVAETNAQTPSSVTLSPSLPSNRQPHARVPSLSLTAPLLPAKVNTSPIATSAQHHRFATTRENTTHRPHTYQPFPSNDDLAVNYGGYPAPVKVDPTTIPLPPQSPPMSTVSLSSRSSASRSSVSYDTQHSEISRSTAPTVHSRLNGHTNIRHPEQVSSPQVSLDGLGIHTELISGEASSSETSWSGDGMDLHASNEDTNDPDRKLKDEAKSNRKIADLEITNRSLLAINSSLEEAKHRQAKEIRDLKRKLRASRLILPPPAYRAVKSSLPHDDLAEDDDVVEDEDVEEEQAILEGKDDEPYRRVKIMVEGLLESCQRALESKPEDFAECSKGGAKVLTEEEVRTWRGDNVDVSSGSFVEVDPDGLPQAGPSENPSDLSSTVADYHDDLGSEDDVEISLPNDNDVSSPTLPPITVTPSV